MYDLLRSNVIETPRRLFVQSLHCVPSSHPLYSTPPYKLCWDSAWLELYAQMFGICEFSRILYAFTCVWALYLWTLLYFTVVALIPIDCRHALCPLTFCILDQPLDLLSSHYTVTYFHRFMYFTLTRPIPSCHYKWWLPPLIFKWPFSRFNLPTVHLLLSWITVCPALVIPVFH